MRGQSHIRRPRSLLVAVLVVILALAITYCALAAYKAFDYTTTPPQPPITQSPADLGLDFASVTFESAAPDHLSLAGWWIPRDHARGVLILVHGRYENRASHLARARPLWDAGYSLLLIDLRGHGESARAPCTYGLRESGDVLGAVAFAEDQGHRPGHIGVIGWSLGAASGLMAMSQTDAIGAMVSDSAYANADPLLARNPLRPGLALAMRLLHGVDLRQVAPERAMAHMDGRPVLLIHGTEDAAVPLAQAERLAQAGSSDVQTWFVPGAGHAGAYAHDPHAYARRVVAFFDATLDPAPEVR